MDTGQGAESCIRPRDPLRSNGTRVPAGKDGVLTDAGAERNRTSPHKSTLSPLRPSTAACRPYPPAAEEPEDAWRSGGLFEE